MNSDKTDYRVMLALALANTRGTSIPRYCYTIKRDVRAEQGTIVAYLRIIGETQK